MCLETVLHENDILQFIVSLNANSEHPLAEATVNYGKEQKIEIEKANEFNAVTGKGVEGNIRWQKIGFGQCQNDGLCQCNYHPGNEK